MSEDDLATLRELLNEYTADRPYTPVALTDIFESIDTELHDLARSADAR